MVSTVTDYNAWWTELPDIQKIKLIQAVGARFGLEQRIWESVAYRFDAIPMATQQHIKLVAAEILAPV